MSKNRRKLITRALLLLLVVGCGVAEEERHIKDFRFYITERNFPEEFTSKLNAILEKLNSNTGTNAFQITDRASEANSYINLSRVKKYFGSHSIGAGGATYKIEKSAPRFDGLALKSTATVSHGMDIDFDRTWVIDNVLTTRYSLQNFGRSLRSWQPRSNRNAIRRNERRDNYGVKSETFEILVLHEIGHGLGFEHVKNPENVMFESISNGKNLHTFYHKVKKILNRNHY